MSPGDSAPRASAGALGAAVPAFFVLLWSTGFVGAKYGLPYAEPFTFLLIRLAIAAALLAGLAAATRSAWPATAAAWRRTAVAGLLLHAGYLGGVFTAIDLGMPAGVAAVIVGIQPLATAALAGILLGERVGARGWAGLAIGLGGVALVLVPDALGDAAGSGLSLAAVAACLAALAATTAGTLYQKRHGDQTPLLSGAAVQYGAASALLLVLALATETMTVRWTPDFIAAMAWLVLALSLGAVLLLLSLLRRGSAARVSSLFYLVPPATAVESYLLFGETLGTIELAGMALAVIGVAVVLVTTAHPR